MQLKNQRNDLAYLELHQGTGTKKQRVARARKMLFGCVDCGYRSHPAALQFDHRPGEVKIHNVAGWPGDLASMILEMDKCDVVCANCHAIRTALRYENPEHLSAKHYRVARPSELEDRLPEEFKETQAQIRERSIEGRLARKAWRDTHPGEPYPTDYRRLSKP